MRTFARYSPYCSIKHRTKYYNHYAPKEAVSQVSLQTLLVSKQNKNQYAYVTKGMRDGVVVFFSIHKMSGLRTLIKSRISPSIQKV